VDTTRQVKSKKRVADHGEVFTAAREVNAMLDLVKNETERIDSRFLEPACGTGNFLVEILNRKLKVVTARYKRNQSEWERYCFIAVSSIYGVDILEDNCVECRKRLFDIVDGVYKKLYNKKTTDTFRASIKFLFEKNIIWGDALTMKQVGKGKENEPITFSEWSAVNGTNIKRRDYTLSHLLETAKYDEPNQPGLLAADKTKAIPRPVAEYTMCHYLRVADAEKTEVCA